MVGVLEVDLADADDVGRQGRSEGEGEAGGVEVEVTAGFVAVARDGVAVGVGDEVAAGGGVEPGGAGVS